MLTAILLSMLFVVMDSVDSKGTVEAGKSIVAISEESQKAKQRHDVDMAANFRQQRLYRSHRKRVTSKLFMFRL